MIRDGREQLVLAIETTAPRSGAALVRASRADVRLLAQRYVSGPGRSETLASCVRDVLDEAAVRAADLTGLAVVDGPGSYTGLRVGLGLARGLAFADGLAVATVGSLELIARAAPVGISRVCALLDASHAKVYAAGCVRDADGDVVEVEPPVIVEVERAAELRAGWDGVYTTCGDSALAAVMSLDEIVADARADVLAAAGAQLLARGDFRRAEEILPRYVGAVGVRPHRGVVSGRELIR